MALLQHTTARAIVDAATFLFAIYEVTLVTAIIFYVNLRMTHVRDNFSEAA